MDLSPPSLQRRPRHAECPRGIIDRQLDDRVEPLDRDSCSRSPEPLTVRLGATQAGHDPLSNPLALELGDCAEHMQHQRPGWARGVDALAECDEPRCRLPAARRAATRGFASSVTILLALAQTSGTESSALMLSRP
jgi:hypothetical protein